MEGDGEEKSTSKPAPLDSKGLRHPFLLLRFDVRSAKAVNLCSTRQARSQGVPLEQLAERLLQEALTASGLPTGVVTVEEFRDMLHGIAEHSEKLPNLPTESFSRESFYEDRLNGRDSVPRR